MSSEAALAAGSTVTFAEAFRVWLKIGLLSFGGPAGQIALMHRLLVDEKRWIGERRFLHALNFCMLLPGPEAQQLAIYVGWLLHGLRGGLVAGTLFVLPGACVILALSILYAGFGQLPAVEALFFGIKAAVLAVVLQALHRIAKRALKGRFDRAVAALAFVGIFFLALPFPLIVIGAALLGALWAGGRFDAGKVGKSGEETDGLAEAMIERRLASTGRGPARALKVIATGLLLWGAPLVLLFLAFGGGSVFFAEGIFFSQMAVVTFGGAYAVLAYIAQQAVELYGWLTAGEMLDGLGLAETTPGPLILVVQFVGFLAAFRNPLGLDPYLAGTLGALVTLWVTFVPCFLWIFLGAPYVEALRGKPALDGALAAITAAVVGVILNLAIWFALHVLFAEVTEVQRFGLRLWTPDWRTLDLWALALSAAAFVALFRFNLGMIATLAAAAALGLVIRSLL
ncbi:MAG: chromate efflux transporter [Kiloniellales bacterium]